MFYFILVSIFSEAILFVCFLVVSNLWTGFFAENFWLKFFAD